MRILLICIAVIIILVVAVGIVKVVLGVGQYKAQIYTIPKSVYHDWQSVLTHKGQLMLETLHVGNIAGTVSGIIDLKNPAAAAFKDGNFLTPVLAYLVHHKKYGYFLIDTGFDGSFADQAGGHFEGFYKKYFKGRYFLGKGQGIDDLLKKKNIKPNYVFLTHFHEHLAGATALPDDIPYIFGKGEKEADFFPLVYSRFLRNKTDVRVIDFTKAAKMPIVGKTVDIFGDGSFWAIATPGHTKGHISYLVNCADSPYLVMGDVCISQKGFQIGVGTGTYSEDIPANQAGFRKLKKFLDTYPQIKPLFGHETDQFRIQYQ